MKHWYLQFHNPQNHNVNMSIIEFKDLNSLTYFSEQADKIFHTEVAAIFRLLGLHSVYCLLTLYSLCCLAPFVPEGCW